MLTAAKLWHIIPIDLGIVFYDSSTSAINGDASFYNLVNTDDNKGIKKEEYGYKDRKYIKFIRNYIKSVKKQFSLDSNSIISNCQFSHDYPGVNGCILHIKFSDNLFLYLCLNGTAVFLEYSSEIDISHEDYFSIPIFSERNQFENILDNGDIGSNRSYQTIMQVLECLRSIRFKRDREYTSSDKFRRKGISYALCIVELNMPSFSSSIDKSNYYIRLKQNCKALIDTSEFINVDNKENWSNIRKKIQNLDCNEFELKPLSESFAYCDGWSGVVLIGDLKKNATVLKWFLELEVYLQSRWLLYEAIGEELLRKKRTSIGLQMIKNIVEMSYTKLMNDISSNMEQCLHEMRESVIKTSEIQRIYNRMHATLERQLEMSLLVEKKKRGWFSLFAEVALFLMAVLQVYESLQKLLEVEKYTESDYLAIAIMILIALLGILAIVKGDKK